MSMRFRFGAILFVAAVVGSTAGVAWGDERAGALEDSAGNVVDPAGAGAYVYSGPSGALDASRAGAILAAGGLRSIVAIADVRGLNWPPVDSIVRGAVAERGKRDGTTVLLDWTGGWGNMMGLPSGGCSVVIMDGETVSSTSSCAVVIGGSVKTE